MVAQIWYNCWLIFLSIINQASTIFLNMRKYIFSLIVIFILLLSSIENSFARSVNSEYDTVITKQGDSVQVSIFGEYGQVKVFTRPFNKKMASPQTFYEQNDIPITVKRYDDGLNKRLNWQDTNNNSIAYCKYYDGLPLHYFVKGVLELKYTPFGEVKSFKFFNNYRKIAISKGFYRNGNIRHLGFQNANKNSISHVDYTDRGDIFFIYSTSHLNPDRLKASKALVKKYTDSTGWTFSPNPFYTDTFRHGEYTLYYGNGEAMGILNFRYNLLHGDFVFFDAFTGDTLVYRHFSDGSQRGYFLDKFAGKTILYQGAHERGQPGFWYERYKFDGTPQEKQLINLSDSSYDHYDYYPDGRLKTHKNESRNMYESYFPRGNISSITMNLEPEGNKRKRIDFYRENNQIKSIKYYASNGQDSIAEGYYKSGRLHYRMNWEKGKRQGPFVEYTKNGSLKQKGQFENNKSHGMWLNFEDGQVDTVYYDHGKQRVKSLGFPCACVDTAQSRHEVNYIPRLARLLDYDEFSILTPSFISPPDRETYEMFSYRGFHTGGSRTNFYATLKLWMYDEFSIRFPADDQIKMCFNPCRTDGYVTKMDVVVKQNNYIKHGQSAQLKPSRISLEFLKGPLKSADKHYENFTAFFNVDAININHREKVSVNLSEDPKSCFISGKINNFIKLNIQEAKPLVFDDIQKEGIDYLKEELQLEEKDFERFFGIISYDADFQFEHKENGQLLEIEATNELLLGSGHFFAAKINIPCHKTGEDTFTINQEQDQITRKALERTMEQNGFSRIKFDYNKNSEVLSMSFFTK